MPVITLTAEVKEYHSDYSHETTLPFLNRVGHEFLEVELIEIHGVKNPSDLELYVDIQGKAYNINFYKHKDKMILQNEVFCFYTKDFEQFKIDLSNRNAEYGSYIHFKVTPQKDLDFIIKIYFKLTPPAKTQRIEQI